MLYIIVSLYLIDRFKINWIDQSDLSITLIFVFKL